MPRHTNAEINNREFQEESVSVRNTAKNSLRSSNKIEFKNCLYLAFEKELRVDVVFERLAFRKRWEHH